MKIGLLIYGLDRPMTGISRYTYELVHALSALPDGPEIVLLAAGYLGPLASQEKFSVIPLPGCHLLPALLTLGNVLLPYLASRLELDLIHDPSGTAPFLFGSGRAKVVVTIHDVFALSIPGYSSHLDNLIYQYWLPRLLPRRVDKIITVSQVSRQDIEHYLHIPTRRIQVIPYGIHDRFQLMPRDKVRAHLHQRFGLDGSYLLYVGALTRRKNIERALQAYAQIALDFNDLRFVLVGPRIWQGTPIEAVIAEHKLQDKVLMTGPLQDDDLPVLYNGASVFVFPSLYEGFGMPPVEAMACGAPVITSNTSSLPEVVGEAALKVDPYNVTAIADAIRRILNDPDLAADLRRRGPAHAQQYTWENTALQTFTLYQEVLH